MIEQLALFAREKCVSQTHYLGDCPICFLGLLVSKEGVVPIHHDSVKRIPCAGEGETARIRDSWGYYGPQLRDS